MRKLWFILVILAAAALAACSPAAPANPTAGPSSNNTPAAPTQQAAAPSATQDPNVKEMSCRLVSIDPTQSPDEASKFPPPSSTDWTLGSSKSPSLTLIEYSDFQCPYCAQLAPVLEELQSKYPDQVTVTFRYFPLPSHPLSLPTAQAAEAAGMQGKFWEMHNALFSQQNTWAAMTPDQFDTWVTQQAKDLGLDVDKFNKDRNSQAVVDKIKAAQQHGIDASIPGTPFVLLNKQIYQGPRDLASLEAVLQLYQLKDKQFTYCPPMQVDVNKQYTATLKTEKGDIVIQLYADKAPMAVNSFVFLARQGWFDNVTFHRVLPDFIAQSGDPSGTGFGGPGYSFDDEITNLKFDKAGVVGMANAGPGSNGSQFFITYTAIPNLDGKYTVFGQVTQGMDVVKQLTARDPSQTMDLPPGDKILSVQITEK